MNNVIICCSNAKEFRNVQLVLFSMDIDWRDRCGELRESDYENCALRIRNDTIEALGKVSRYKANNYIHIDTSDYEIVSSILFIRRLKLRRLNEG